jgi:hypothetical protein
MSNLIPMPDRLEPKSRKRMLLTSVRGYFYPLYNASGPKFRNMLASVNNKTALTGNRNFDRKEAVDMIVSAAKEAKDTATAETKAGEIYRCLVHVMSEHEELKLKLRRQAYERLTQQAAE